MVLPHLTVLGGQYAVQSVLGEVGPFDVSYLTWDLKKEQEVVVREYYPIRLAKRGRDGVTFEVHDVDLFQHGLDGYWEEATRLSRVDHPAVVRQITYFQENGTVYQATQYHTGASLSAYLMQQGGRLPEGEALDLMQPLLGGLQAAHEEELYHGCLSPRKIFVQGANEPMVLGFQAARMRLARRSESLADLAVSPFGPPEFLIPYGAIGPWSDLYACAATLYCILTGHPIPKASERMHEDRVPFLLRQTSAISPGLRAALEQALELDTEDRPSSVDAFQRLLRKARSINARNPADVNHSPAVEIGYEPLDGPGRYASTSWEDEALESGEPPLETPFERVHEMANSERPPNAPRPSKSSSAPPSSRSRMAIQAAGDDDEVQALLEEVVRSQRYFNLLILVVVLALIGAGGYMLWPVLQGNGGQGPGPSMASAEAGREVPPNDPGDPLDREPVPVVPDGDGAASAGDDTEAAVEPAPAPAPAVDALLAREAEAARETAAALRAAQARADAEAQAAAEARAATQALQAAEARAALQREQRYLQHQQQGDSLFGQRRLEEARRSFQSALTFKPGDEYAAAMVGRIEEQLEEARQSETQYQYHRGQGDVFAEQGNMQQALTSYEAALEYRTDDAYLQERIADIRDSLSSVEAAVAEEAATTERLRRLTDEDGIFVAPEVPARLIDEAAMQRQIRYPSRARRAGVEGRVTVRMVIDEQGRMTDPTVVEGIGFGCDAEVLRVLGEAQFEPARFDDQPVKAWFMYSLMFSAGSFQ